MSPDISIIVPAHNEAAFIDTCLAALMASSWDRPGPVEIVVVANACTDATAAMARNHQAAAAAKGWTLRVLECEAPGKLNALNLAEAGHAGAIRLYLDADVRVSPDLIAGLVSALDDPAPAYASGTPVVSPAHSRITRAYARFWAGLPFFIDGVPGFGVFAVNANGRARWGAFPDIISDDTFVRLQFAPGERIRVAQSYAWPMVEGLRNLVRVRRRQNAGVAEIARLYPRLGANEDDRRMPPAELWRRLRRDPLGFGVYALVSVAVKLPVYRSNQRWTRGR